MSSHCSQITLILPQTERFHCSCNHCLPSFFNPSQQTNIAINVSTILKNGCLATK
uniref:Uncharacterized protein n=1 Tax=Rhizophora mucronata TaxID=61149 RepID=A0A2P2NEP5_RHIMU